MACAKIILIFSFVNTYYPFFHSFLLPLPKPPPSSPLNANRKIFVCFFIRVDLSIYACELFFNDYGTIPNLLHALSWKDLKKNMLLEIHKWNIICMIILIKNLISSNDIDWYVRLTLNAYFFRLLILDWQSFHLTITLMSPPESWELSGKANIHTETIIKPKKLLW